MHKSDSDSEPAVVHAFLCRVTADDAVGARRSLVEYQALFVGHEDLVARELQALESASPPLPQTCLGPYVLQRELGRGGQATVYLAHDPRLQRDVALKVLTRDHASLGAELRLQREASVAARVDDPGICPVYEVGRDGDHVFLAMRYVPGRTLAAELATLRSRLQEGGTLASVLPKVDATLQQFEALASSLQRAHESGVVHRDLKPANIMVGPQAPVLLDFGLAITADDQAAPLTRTGDVFGTPHYLSPERLSRPAHRGDERDDLWALAVTLYETLTLQRPFAAPTLEQLYRSILDATPARPSALRPGLPRDLDAVLATALAADPARRYRTATDFAADLRAVRLHQPIRARPPGRLRRLRAWHRRHPALATAAWLVTAGIASTIAVQQTSLYEVRAAQRESADLNTFLIEKLLLAGTPENARGETLTVAQVFDAARVDVDGAFPKPTRTSGSIHHVLGLANSRLGRAREARAAIERAVSIRTQVLGSHAPETLASRSELVDLLRRTDDTAAAAAELATLLPTMEKVFGASDRRTLGCRVHEVRIAMSAGRWPDAERLARSIQADTRDGLGADDQLAIQATQLLAQVLEQRGQRAAAEPLMRDVVDRRRRLLGANSPALVAALSDLASLLHDMAHRDGVVAKYAESAQVAATALEATEHLHGKNSLSYAISLNTFASLQQERAQRTGDPEAARRAVAMFRESLELREAINGPRSTSVAVALGNLGGALFDVRELDEARTVMERALTLRETLVGPRHPDTVRSLFNLMMLHDRRKDRAAAFAARDDLTARLAVAEGIDEKTRLAYRAGVVRVLWHFSRFEQAVREGEPLYEDCLRVWPGDGGPTGRATADLVAGSYLQLGNLDAEARWRERGGSPK